MWFLLNLKVAAHFQKEPAAIHLSIRNLQRYTCQFHTAMAQRHSSRAITPSARALEAARDESSARQAIQPDRESFMAAGERRAKKVTAVVGDGGYQSGEEGARGEEQNNKQG